MSSALMAPNPDAAEILLRVYHGSGVTRAELTESLGVRAGVVAAALDAFTDANLILLDEHWYYPSLNGDTDAAARREYARLSGARACRTCGCTDQWACEGGCEWIDTDLCSTCDPTIIRMGGRTSFVIAEDEAYIETELADDEDVRLSIRRGEDTCSAVLTPAQAIAVATKLLMYASAAENDGELL